MHITILEKKLKQTGSRYYGTVGVAGLKYKILLTGLVEIVNINIARSCTAADARSTCGLGVVALL